MSLKTRIQHLEKAAGPKMDELHPVHLLGREPGESEAAAWLRQMGHEPFPVGDEVHVIWLLGPALEAESGDER